MWKQHLILFFINQFSRCIVQGFNVEIDHYAAYKGDTNSMFGFSVSEYRDQNHRGWIIIGAPLNNSTHMGIERGGAVFKCEIEVDNKCFPLEFDSKGTNYAKSIKNGIEPIDNKSYQWFGATISTSIEDGGPILACAPKYHWFGYIKANWSIAGFKDAVGTCWLTSLNKDSPNEYSPCRNNDTAGHHRQGMCQAGFGAAMSKDGTKLFIGAPGSWYWQGQLFMINSNVTMPFVPVKDSYNALKKDNLHSLHGSSKYLATYEGPAYEDNSYLGYSVTVGDFLGNGDSGVAVGAPRGSELYGKVLIFTSQLFNHQNITGDQMGAFFGYSLAANDIDGDDKDDLIISAPFYTRPEYAGIKIETGRIYVFYQGNEVIKYQKFDMRDGEYNRGQFGLSIASLGDIDLDGYGDIVIGEPYGGQENRGAIYIYHGSKEGIEKKYSQVIFSENLEQPVRTFGWSLSAGIDLDKNLYPDIVVGAYESNTVIYFRTRPVINMISEINFLTDSINLKNKACVLSDGTAVACSELKICCMYTGQGSWSQHEFIINISLDDKKKNPRLFFLNYENRNILNWTISIMKDQLYCRQIKVYVAEHLRDKLTTLDAEMHIKLLTNNSHSSVWKKRDPKAKLLAILGQRNTNKRDSLTIQKNCGYDNICIPDLAINVIKNVEEYILGSGKILELEVYIHNNGEDAFEAVFYLHLPIGIDYVNIESLSEFTEIIIQCSAPKLNNNNTLRCDIGNPLPQNKVVKFKIILQPQTFDGMNPSYELFMEVNSTNPENFYSLDNNKFNISLPIRIEMDISIDGESKPYEIYFNSLDQSIIEPAINAASFEPTVTHNYTIRNNGPLTVLSINASLIWTAETFTGDILLYLIEQPEISTKKIYCDSANADYLSFKNKKESREMSTERNSLTNSRNIFNEVDKIKDQDLKREKRFSHGYNCFANSEIFCFDLVKIYHHLTSDNSKNNYSLLNESNILYHALLAMSSKDKQISYVEEFDKKEFHKKNLKFFKLVRYKMCQKFITKQCDNTKYFELSSYHLSLINMIFKFIDFKNIHKICSINDEMHIQFYAKLHTTKDNKNNYIKSSNGHKFFLYDLDYEQKENNFISNNKELVKCTAYVKNNDYDIYCCLKNGRILSINQSHFWQTFSNIVKNDSNMKMKQLNKRYVRQISKNLYSRQVEKIHRNGLFNNTTLCKAAQCVNLQCYIGPLEKDEEVFIAAKYRIHIEALKKITQTEKIKVSSKLIITVTSQPFIKETIKYIVQNYEISTQIIPIKNIYNSDVWVQLWIVVLAACTGTAILLLLTYVLYKCGFFKRNRPSNTSEKQPLNRTRRFSSDDD